MSLPIRPDTCENFLFDLHSHPLHVFSSHSLRSGQAHYSIDAGDLAVIRPLVYCRESLMTNFAKDANLPVINENCPACFEEPKERARTKKLLSREETLYPHFYDNIRRSLIPLMHDDMSGILRGYTEDAVSKSRKEPFQKGRKRKMDFGEGQNDRLSEKRVENLNEAQLESHTLGSGGISFKSLSSATEEELSMELARRKANRFRRSTSRDTADPTGVVCTLNGGNGSIPCRELME